MNSLIEIKSGNNSSRTINNYITAISTILINKAEVTLAAKQNTSSKLVSIVEILKRKINIQVKYSIQSNQDKKDKSNFLFTALIHLENEKSDELKLKELINTKKISDNKCKIDKTNIDNIKDNSVYANILNNIDCFDD